MAFLEVPLNVWGDKSGAADYGRWVHDNVEFGRVR